MVPTRVARRPDGTGWVLLRGDEPYFVRGVGGTGRAARAAELGANSMRTWSATELGAALDTAHAAGLTVCAGLWVRHASLGPDWYEGAAHAAERQAKLDEFRAVVREHRAHPALLLWAVGNEPNASGFNAHAPLWRFVNQVARLVKEEDPHHAVTTVTTSPTEELAASLKAHCPAVDVWSVNVYGKLLSRLPQKMQELGWSKAYCVTEYGPMNWWQVKTTSWGAPLEPTSSQKAATYANAVATFSADKACIGGYAFKVRAARRRPQQARLRRAKRRQMHARRTLLAFCAHALGRTGPLTPLIAHKKYGWKDQVTVTWINLLNEYPPTIRPNGPLQGGEECAAVDEISRVWRGEHLKHRAPALVALTVNGLSGADDVRLAGGSAATARCEASHPDRAKISYLWHVIPEGGKLGERVRQEGQSWKGGVPQPVDGCVTSQDDARGSVAFSAPRIPGYYRLFVWAYDAHNKFGSANVPFEVVGGAAAPPAVAPVAAAAPPPTAAPMRSASGTTMLPCAADGYVRDGAKYERACFSSETTLVTKRPDTPGSGYGRTAYVSFALPQAAQVQRALLRVFAVSGDGGGKTVVNVHAADAGAWDEAALCAGNAPQPGPQPLASVRVAGFACYLAWDVTAHVQAAARSGASRVTFALQNAEPSEKTNTWQSRRAGADTAPQLELTC
jgi:hypothetical protein